MYREREQAEPVTGRNDLSSDELRARIRADVQNEAQALFDAAYRVSCPGRKLDKVHVHHITNIAQPRAALLMQKMYALYTRLFPIADERESLEKIMDLLSDANGSAMHGGAPSLEQWVLLENEQGDVVAAHNSVVFSAIDRADVNDILPGTMHLHYIFVDPDYRGHGLTGIAEKAAHARAREFIAATYGHNIYPDSVAMLEFAEQNAPMKMTPAEFLTDTAGSMTDQFWRRTYFEKMGFRPLDMDYIQLPLSPREQGGRSVTSMDMICRGIPAPAAFVNVSALPDHIPSELVAFHLYNFFVQSVAAGQYDIGVDPDWIAQKAQLQKRAIRVRESRSYEALKKAIWDRLESIVYGPDFDADAFHTQTVAAVTGIRDDGADIPAHGVRPAGPEIHYASAVH